LRSELKKDEAFPRFRENGSAVALPAICQEAVCLSGGTAMIAPAFWTGMRFLGHKG
jgi:hypothetical protein